MFKCITYRRTKRENYKIVKKRKMNGQPYYVVQFLTMLIGWHTFEEMYDSVTSVEIDFDDKDNAKQFIESKVNEAYNKLRK